MMNSVVATLRDVPKLYHRAFCSSPEKRWVATTGSCSPLTPDSLGGRQPTLPEHYIGVKLGTCNCVWSMIKALLILVVMLYVCHPLAPSHALRNASFVSHHFLTALIRNDTGTLRFFCFLSSYQMNSSYMLILGGAEISLCVLRYVG